MHAVFAKVMGGALGMMVLLGAHHARADMLGSAARPAPAPVHQTSFACGSSLANNLDMERVTVSSDHDVAIMRDARSDQTANRWKTISI